MGFTIEKQMVFLGLVVLFPLLCTSDNTFTSSRATYYGSPEAYGTPGGTCGYGGYGKTVNFGNVAGVSRLYKNGSGCGACYQVKCTDTEYCSDDGVNVVVTDSAEGDRTDFVLSTRAYTKLAKPNLAMEMFDYGAVDIEYRRISCKYPGYNLMIKVHEQSKYPQYLAIVVLYVAGQNDLTAVELWQEDLKEWNPLRRAFGTVFDYANPPLGSINLRFQLSGNAGYTWVQSNNAIPGCWKAGALYDSSIKLA
ncbi:hypothetical protein FEM48_Zijuj11G0069900 [Ziziphus jujuba var. spinosa]|uniref:Expansin-like B1 n=1 Tax=Ziziphus jujuba var. spinosa TaxID=714518 RepID=A0A978UHH9_ZIZJJ|nr:hypothetical protein FEM48_Zijuj11G0069900 [Ziziphus jujuba var. spinosa]